MARLEGRQLHEYRGGFREWLYDMAKANDLAKSQGWRHVTFTLADAEINGSVISNHDPEHLRRLLENHARKSNVDGFVVLEFGQRGNRRIHAHMLADGNIFPSQMAARWRDSNLGHVVDNEVIDLLGVVAYITKSIGPESLFVACGRYRKDRDGV